jgi:hypothetical protein
MNQHLQALYDSLQSETTLQEIVRERREEDLYLEFKQKADRRTGDLMDSDRKAFSKALSGFANGDGGVLEKGSEKESEKGSVLDIDT